MEEGHDEVEEKEKVRESRVAGDQSSIASVGVY